MAAVTLGVGFHNTAAGPHSSGAFTPAAGDLLVAFYFGTGTSGVVPTCTSTGNTAAWTLVDTIIFETAGNNGRLYVWIQDALCTAVSTNVTCGVTDDNTSGGHVIVCRASGMTKVGDTGAKKQSSQDNVHATGTPQVATMAASVDTANPTIGAVHDEGTGVGWTPPTGWTELDENVITTPDSRAEVCSRDSGYTGTSITWGSSSTGEYASYFIELDSSGAGGGGGGGASDIGWFDRGAGSGELHHAAWFDSGLLDEAWFDYELIEQGVAGGTTFPKALAVAATYTVALQKQANKILAVAATFLVAIAKLVGKTIALGAAYTVATLKMVTHFFADLVVTYTPALATMKVLLKALTVGVTYTVTLTKQANKLLVVGITYAVALLKRVNKLFALAATYTVALLKFIFKTLSPISVTYTVILTAIKVVLKALVVTATYTVVLTKQAGKPLSLGATYTVAFARQTQKVLVRGVTYTVAMSKRALKSFALTTTYTVALGAIKVILRALSVGITYTVSLTKQATHPLAVGATYVVALTKRAGKNFVVGTTYVVSMAAVRIGQTIQKALSLVVTYSPVLVPIHVVRVISEMVSRGLGYFAGNNPFRLHSPPRRRR